MARTLSLLLICFLLSACNIPSAPPDSTPTPDLIATQVSLLLTEAPTATQTQLVPTLAASTNTAPAQPTVTFTETPPSTLPTATDTPAVSSNDPPDWKDTLDGGKAFYQYENENTKVTQESGHLALTGTNANGWLGWSLTFSRKPADFRLEATFVTQTCSGSDMYGLIFRAPNANSGYFYGVTCDGQYNLHARDFENETDTILLNLNYGSGINAGSNMTNKLAVRAEGTKIGLYANDVLLQEVTDSTYASGSFGPFVAANETPGFTVWMEEIALWELP